MMHTLKLDDMELTALITHLEGQSEMMVESRLNCSNPSELPDREEAVSYTHLTLPTIAVV